MNRYSKSYTVKAGTVLLSTLLLLGSCSEDAIFDDNGGNLGAASDNICFGISDKDGWPDSRSTRGNEAEDTVTGSFVLRSADNADTLCVQTIVSDFGPLPFGGNAPMSRAALVTDGNMHESFGVTACIYTGTEKAYYFFNEKNTKPANYNASAIWTYASGNIYYWPGADHKMQFYAYSPYECKGLTKPQNATPGTAPTFSYTVPSDAVDQTDILAYATDEMAGDAKTSVPLKFDHICTAVQFVVGKEMQPGSIKSITLKGVKNVGSYSFESNSWTLGKLTADFVHNVNKSVNASAPDDTPKESITDDAGCFVMLPQTLPDGASVEITFHDNTTGKDRTLTASLAGQEWPQGKRVKYNISITPDYILDITDLPETQDAHYVICKTSVKAEKIPAGKNWTLKAKASDGADVTMLTQLNQYQQNGFWTDRILFQSSNSTSAVDQGSARGTNTLSGTGNTDVYIFLPENVSDNERSITLTLTLEGTSAPAVEKEFKQLNPDWVGDYGWEQIENDPQANWGFDWNRKVTYRKNNVLWNLLIYGPMINDLVKENQAEGYTSVSKTGFLQRTIISIDYSKLNNLNSLNLTDNNGLNNTRVLFEFSGSATTGNLEQDIKNLAQRGSNGVFDITTQSGTNNMESAALGYILKKNRYNILKIEKKDDEGNIVVSESAVIKRNDIVWYLPAKSQMQSAPSNQPLKGVYWSSTPDGNSNAWASNGETLIPQSAQRSSMNRVRACRNR